MTQNIHILGSEVTTFHNFGQWQSRGAVLLKHNSSEVILCVATDGSVCHIGQDFEYARDNQLFPVKAYRLERSSEV